MITLCEFKTKHQTVKLLESETTYFLSDTLATKGIPFYPCLKSKISRTKMQEIYLDYLRKHAY